MVATTPSDARQHPAPKVGGMPSISLTTLWRAIRRYSAVLGIFAVLAAAAGGGTYWFFPLPKMTAYTIYHVAMEPPAVLSPAFDSRVNFTAYKQQQQAILKSRQVLNHTLSAPAVADLPMLQGDRVQADPVSHLADQIKIDSPTGPEYMRVSLEGDDGDQMVAILKSLNEAYVKLALDKDKNDRLARLETLRQLQRQYDEELRKNRETIRNVVQQIGLGDPLAMALGDATTESQIRAIQGRIAALAVTKLEQGVEAERAQTALTQPAPAIPEAFMAKFIEADPEYQRLVLERKLMADKIKANEEKVAEGAQHPVAEALKPELVRLDAEIKGLPGLLKPQIEARYKESVALGGQERLTASRASLETAEMTRKALLDEVEKLIESRKDVRVKSYDLETLRTDASYTAKIADNIRTQIEQLKPEINAPNRVTLWEEPVAVLGVEGNRRVKYTAMAAGGILLLGLALVQWLDIRNRRVHTIEEVTAGTGLTVLGSMPRYPRNPRADESATWNHLLAESVNTTRTMILSPRAVPGGAATPAARTILVTSASSGEGKTSLTTHLAVSLANAGRSVLLIDADMRRPAAHAVLDVPLSPGLSEYLTGGLAPEEVAQRCNIPGLTVVAAGKWNEGSSAALSGGRWHDLIALAGGEYDFVLIDSPPVLPVADALAIARQVDGVLMSVMQDQSRYQALQAACNRLSLVGARMLGVVMAGATANGGHYYRDRYYSSYKPQHASAS